MDPSDVISEPAVRLRSRCRSSVLGGLTVSLRVVSSQGARPLGGPGSSPLCVWADSRYLVGSPGRARWSAYSSRVLGPLACSQGPLGTHEVSYLVSDLRRVRYHWTRGLPPNGQRPWTGPRRLAGRVVTILEPLYAHVSPPSARRGTAPQVVEGPAAVVELFESLGQALFPVLVRSPRTHGTLHRSRVCGAERNAPHPARVALVGVVPALDEAESGGRRSRLGSAARTCAPRRRTGGGGRRLARGGPGSSVNRGSGPSGRWAPATGAQERNTRGPGR